MERTCGNCDYLLWQNCHNDDSPYFGKRREHDAPACDFWSPDLYECEDEIVELADKILDICEEK